MIRKSWSAKSIFRCTWPRPKTFARRPTRAGSFGPKPRRYYVISDPVFFQLVISCRSNYKESFSPASHLREGFFSAKMLGIYCVCYRKDRTIIFCLVASGSKSFWLLHLPVRREFFAAKKHLLLASFTLTRTSQLTARQKKVKVLLSLLGYYFREKRPLRNVFWVKVLRPTNATRPVYIPSPPGITRRSTPAIVSGTISCSGKQM